MIARLVFCFQFNVKKRETVKKVQNVNVDEDVDFIVFSLGYYSVTQLVINATSCVTL